MISGSSSAKMLFFNLGTTYGSLLPADADGSVMPPAGSPNYLADLSTNSLHIWQAKVDWNTTTNSSVTLVNTLATQAYSYSGITISQPGTTQTLDALATRLMYRLQYRNFGSYQVMLTNHSVNADGTGRAGVRWYELRNSGTGWSIYQQGTYAPADGNSRWMGSVAMNGKGDIGLGYSVSSTTTYPSIRFTGQTAANSGTGVLDVTETSIKAGALSQTGVNRWGDYSMMSVDPTDDATFWYTSEYSGGGWDWKTQIASFNFGASVVIAPVANFSATPLTVTTGQQVSFTDLSTNNPTSWSWVFTGATPSTSTEKNPVVTYPAAGKYTVSLTATNSAGSNTITKTDYITVTTSSISYCVSKGSNTSYEWINSVTLGSYTNLSGSNSGYGNFISTVIPLISGSSSNLVLSPGFSGKSRSEYWKVWIDYNKDGDFLDAGENVYSAIRQKGSVSGTIAVPAGLTGDTRMRIAMKYAAASTSCELFTYGEVEDYTVAFASAISAPVANLPCNSASTATSNSKANNLKLEIYPNPASDLLNVLVTGAEKTFNIKVYNALGQIIDDFNVTDSQATINLSKYNKGIFYLGVDDGIHNALKKFIKE
jgi:PKD repeat protein